MTARDIFDQAAKRMDRQGLRVNNERAVLMAVATSPGASPADIARRTGLGPQTVSRIVEQLFSAGLVRRGESLRGRRGQPATPIFLASEGAFCIGCEVGWRHLTVLIRDLTGRVLAEHRRDYAFPDARTIFAEIGSLSRLMVAAVPEKLRERIVGIGLATPGSMGRNLDLVGGTAADARAWDNIDVVREAEAASGLTVFLLNDGNAACWAELVSRPVPRPDNMAYFLVSDFVGAGLIADGRLWEGPTGNSANLGSMLVTGRDGTQNFVHRIASLEALRLKLTAAGAPPPLPANPETWDWDGHGAIIQEWLEDGAFAIAKTVVNTSAVMEFGMAVVDGAMPRPVVTRLVERVRYHLDRLPSLTTDHPRIEEGLLGARAPALGAATKPLYRRFFSRERDDVEA